MSYRKKINLILRQIYKGKVTLLVEEKVLHLQWP